MLKTKHIFITLFIFLLAACGSDSTPTPTPEPPTSEPPAGEPIRIGVLAIRSAEAATAQYGPIFNYLGEQIGRPVEIVPVGQEEQFEQVEQANVDFTINNPLAAVQLRRMYKTEFLVTFSRANTGPEFSGLIIAKQGSGIESIEDLKDKRVTCVAFQTAAAGCNFQVYHVLQAGMSPEEFANFSETPSQDNIVLGVLNETFDAGFIRTGQLEKMVSEGTLPNLDEIFIVDQAQDDFFYPHTTRLYPEWPFAALVDTEPDLAAQTKDVLLNMPTDHPALAQARAVGFVPAIDYTPLDDLIELLELRSYDVER